MCEHPLSYRDQSTQLCCLGLTSHHSCAIPDYRETLAQDQPHKVTANALIAARSLLCLKFITLSSPPEQALFGLPNWMPWLCTDYLCRGPVNGPPQVSLANLYGLAKVPDVILQDSTLVRTAAPWYCRRILPDCSCLKQAITNTEPKMLGFRSAVGRLSNLPTIGIRD